MRTKQKSAFADRKMLGRAIKDSFVKLSPKTQAKNPVMFLVFVAAILTSILWVVSLFGLKDAGDCHYPLVYRAICQLCRGHCRRSW